MQLKDIFIKHAPGHLYWKDLNGVYQGCNEAFAKLLNLSSTADIVGKTDYDFFANPELAKAIMAVDKDVMTSGIEKTIEEIGIDNEGNLAIYLSKKAPLYNDQRQIVGVIGTSLNVTSQKHAQIIASTPGNLYCKDREGRYLWCNNNQLTIANVNSQEEIIGKTDHDLYSKDIADRIKQIDDQVMNNKTEQTFEEVGVDPDGNEAIYLTKKIPLFDNSGKVCGILGISLNITERKAAEKAKAEFLSGMSHDLRTPFSGILGMADYLYRNENDETKKQLLCDIITSGKHLLSLLNEVLELSAIGSNPVKFSTFNIKNVLIETTELMQAEAHMKKLKINVNCESKMITSDKQRISRIVLNLVNNAVKFTKKGQIDIDVETTPTLKISVKDTGIGIPEDKLTTIFEKFSKVKPSYQEKNFTGAGLGLYISKQLANELGGDIEVKSILKKGSCFTFHINNLSRTNTA